MKPFEKNTHGLSAESSSREIIAAMLGRGNKYVPCYVHDSIVEPNHICCHVFIKGIHEDGRYIDENHELWEYATPFDVTTGKPITQFTRRMASLSVPHYNC